MVTASTNSADLKNVRQRRYLARDFDSLRATLLQYARSYFPDKIQDFSESSLAGLLLDLASSVGDNLSFYLDSQFGELSYETAIENVNIERMLRTANVPIVGSAPAIVPVTAWIEVPASFIDNETTINTQLLPIVQHGSIFSSDQGIDFILLEDIDFTKTKSDGTLSAERRVGQQTSTGVIQTFILAASGLCVSGKEVTETISLGDFVSFRKITLSNANVTDIVSVTDGNGNTYYQVNDLSHDVVYKNVLNTAQDNDIVKDALKVIPAPYRFTINTDLGTRKTTLIFGAGSADTLEDDIIPDPSEFAISLPYQQTFSRIAINPEKLLSTKTLGVCAVDTTLSITYRFGGGLDHNVDPDSIRTSKILKMFFPGNPQAATAARIKGSLELSNTVKASGGDDAPTTDDLKQLIPAMKNSQERIVTRSDLLARVYTIPANFGRVFRASTRSNPNNPLATQLFIVSRSPEQKLITSPDTLKTNLIKYLNPYRSISDAIDILDAQIINVTLLFEVLIDPSLNRSIVLQNILTKLQKQFDIKNFYIDQPLVLSEISNTIFLTPGVITINKLEFKNITGVKNNLQYSDVVFDITANTKQGMVIPSAGGIFECRYPEYDIIGRAVV